MSKILQIFELIFVPKSINICENSHMYLIVRIEHSTRLIEVYQPCPNGEIIVKQIASLPFKGINKKYIWEKYRICL